MRGPLDRVIVSRLTIIVVVLAAAACAVKAAYEIYRTGFQSHALDCLAIRDASGPFVCQPPDDGNRVAWTVAAFLLLLLAIVLWRVQTRRGKRMARDGGPSAAVGHSAS